MLFSVTMRAHVASLAAIRTALRQLRHAHGVHESEEGGASRLVTLSVTAGDAIDAERLAAAILVKTLGVQLSGRPETVAVRRN